MANLWATLRLNYPNLVFDLLLLAFAGWLVAAPRRRTRVAIWAAFGLFGMWLVRSSYLVLAAARMNLTSGVFMALLVVQFASLGLLFAAVLVDRRRGPPDG